MLTRSLWVNVASPSIKVLLFHAGTNPRELKEEFNSRVAKSSRILEKLKGFVSGKVILTNHNRQEQKKKKKQHHIKEVIMGTRKSSSFSFCGIFKSCFSGGSSRDDYYWEDSLSGQRIFASDEDRGRWVAEPGIDRKASAFIARFYASRVSDSEHQFAP